MPELAPAEYQQYPELGTLGTRIAQYMWTMSLRLEIGAGVRIFRVEGLIKTRTSPETDAEWRREAMESYNELLQLLASAGVKHYDHPQIHFDGEVYDQPDGIQTLTRQQGRIYLAIEHQDQRDLRSDHSG